MWLNVNQIPLRQMLGFWTIMRVDQLEQRQAFAVTDMYLM